MKSILHLLTFLIAITAMAQTQSATDSIAAQEIPSASDIETTSYPEGVYPTMEDFLNKKPNNQRVAPLYAKSLFGQTLDYAPDNCFFYYGGEEKVKAFAVSFKGSLYFQIKHILKNKQKKGRSEDHVNPNMFVQVIVETPDYIYTESDFGNSWSMGLAANMHGNMRALYERTGVVWDKANKVFCIMKICEDFNEFIKPLKPEFIQPCSNKESRPNLGGMRAAIAAFK